MILRTQAAIVILAGVIAASVPARAGELILPISGSQTATRKTVRYECDAKGVSLGLPSGPFSVDYINTDDNHLAVVPIKGKSIVFANVMSGSGARYAAREFIWWDGRTTTFSTDSASDKTQSVCKVVGR